MKVSGPTQIPSAGTAPTESIEGAGASEVANVDGTATADAAPESGRVAAPGKEGTFAVADIARELDAGQLNPQLALERVMDRVLDRQLAHDTPAVVRDQIRTVLLDALENDPMLAQKLAQLG